MIVPSWGRVSKKRQGLAPWFTRPSARAVADAKILVVRVLSGVIDDTPLRKYKVYTSYRGASSVRNKVNCNMLCFHTIVMARASSVNGNLVRPVVSVFFVLFWPVLPINRRVW